MKKSNMEDWQTEDAQRLRALWETYRNETGTSQAELGALAGIGTQGMVYQYISGTTPLNLSAVGKFARAFNVKIDEISPILADQVRDLYLLCDSQRNVDYGVDQNTREFIQEEIRKAMAQARSS